MHSSMLTVFIGELFRETGIAMEELDAVAVSKGPGSYTGLRIGVAAAKGLCYGLDKPLISVSTLQSMARGMAECDIHNDPETKTLYAPMIDARRMEVYTGLFDGHGHEFREVRAEIIDAQFLEDIREQYRIVLAGDGAEKCRTVLEDSPQFIFADPFHISARHMVSLASERFASGRFEDLAYFEPFYLKEFVAGKPRVKGLHEFPADKAE